MADEHEHEFIQPHDVFESDGVTHHRVLRCECGASPTPDSPEYVPGTEGTVPTDAETEPA